MGKRSRRPDGANFTTANEEHEEIRCIAASLNLSQRQVNDAREQASRRRVDDIGH